MAGSSSPSYRGSESVVDKSGAREARDGRQADRRKGPWREGKEAGTAGVFERSEGSEGKLVGAGLEGVFGGEEAVIGEVGGGGKGARVFDGDKSGGKEAEGEGNEAADGRRRRVVFGLSAPLMIKQHGSVRTRNLTM